MPYRLCCRTIAQVMRFAQTVISKTFDVAIELHQFDGLNNTFDDAYNIDWEYTDENENTELVAFDFYTNRQCGGEHEDSEFKSGFSDVLRVLMDTDVI